MGASQHHAVVMRFMAVPIHQHDITRLHDGLDNDLVAGGCAIGREECLLRAEGAGCQLLRLFYRSVGFQKAVQTT